MFFCRVLGKYATIRWAFCFAQKILANLILLFLLFIQGYTYCIGDSIPELISVHDYTARCMRAAMGLNLLQVVTTMGIETWSLRQTTGLVRCLGRQKMEGCRGVAIGKWAGTVVAVLK
jgi:hypothetical protein